ncbi:iron uptake transporter deferrochelatase/peroxidase subunit [Novosphingobium terrae]|uniref:iron uptake transporter deferrochelatase/peroxidase subunit n=1 Tax=Novosphingobium terrae TaxID=2726189 RepID=UPI0019806CBA|nr:iron uptake transporter deferrochelatase/peroxidase subunit [Novosphingobium terrae]
MVNKAGSGASRRGFLGQGLLGGVAALAGGAAAQATPPRIMHGPGLIKGHSEPFYGRYQAGIITPTQQYLYFAALDVTAEKREEVIDLLRRWTQAAARLTVGLDVEGDATADQPPANSLEAEGLGPARLTLTFGFGAGLFTRDGTDRFGLAARRPEALIDLPRFNGDQLLAEKTGGDLCIQACADNATVAMHAVRQLIRLGYGLVQPRWVQTGFGAGGKPGETPRNLMGFKDGTMNPDTRDATAMGRFVWVGDEGGWMKGGSYLVARPIRIALEHWDRMKLGFQEQVVGRHKRSGAPLGGSHEFEPLRLDAVDADGNPVIPENSHTRLGAPQVNDGAQILRRAYAYDNGVAHIAERWPPWRQGVMMDAGLMFLAWQRDPRTGFVKIFENMAKFDMMNQFVTHIGSGLFACPPGARAGGYVGETLFA